MNNQGRGKSCGLFYVWIIGGISLYIYNLIAVLKAPKMIISEEEQWERDFDWFAVDEDGHIGHFTTAGFKHLPRRVCESAEDLQRVTDYFYNNAPVRGTFKAADSFKNTFLTRRELENSRYIQGFARMAEKGLYSYDIDSYLTSGIAYFQAAIPQSPLTLNDLPEDIRKIVHRTKLENLCFAESPKIDYESTLSI